jgi:hypothetical protein
MGTLHLFFKPFSLLILLKMKTTPGSGKRLLLAAGFLLFGAFGTTLPAQDLRTERVSFPTGESSATVEGSITGRETVDYLLKVRSGQTMKVRMASGNKGVYFNLMEPGEEYVAIYNGSINGNQFEGTTAKSGDYRIRVYLMKGARDTRADYRLEMIVSGSGQSGSSGDARVSGTDYNATGNVPCTMGSGRPTTTCAFGVVRRGEGEADVHVTRSDGAIRVIYFQGGTAVGYDKSQGDTGDFHASRESGLYIIRIGSERYEIPEAVVYGG